ncbi:MAG: ATP-binding protein [Desulfonatronovibrio sp.]|nr:hypothetical protein [Desulfovibrionales bacterium]
MIIPTNISFDLSSFFISLEYHFKKNDTVEFNKALKDLHENFYALSKQHLEDKAEIDRLKRKLEDQACFNKEIKKSLADSHNYYQANLETFLKLKQHIEQVQQVQNINELPDHLMDIQSSMQVQKVHLVLDEQKFSIDNLSAISLLSQEKIQAISNYYQQHYKTHIIHGLCSQVLDKQNLSDSIENLNQEILHQGSCFIYIISDKYNPDSAMAIFTLFDPDPERFSQEKATDYLAHFSQILGNSILSLWAQQKLNSQTKELERSNTELEQFAYVASHDLQEPLRKIQVFGDRLKVKQYLALDEQGKDYLERMQNAAERMQTMINDLLSFSRVTTRAKPFVMISLDQVVQEAISNLEISIEKSQAIINVMDLPEIEADPLQIRQLLENLIGNALKYYKDEEPPRVEISGTELYGPAGEKLYNIEVKDNGIGFDEKYLNRIFQTFQRLHGRGSYSGTGIGLAICRKIAERHQGSITARSKPGEGAAFIVTLPKYQGK